MAGNPPGMRGDGMNLGGVQGNLSQQNPASLLPTFIYDYFIKKREFDLASMILNSSLKVQTTTRKAEPNGVDEDSKDELQRKLDTLPRPATQEQLPDSPFLDDWWVIFWDIWSASRGKGNKNSYAAQYFQMNQAANRNRSAQHQNMIQGNMMNGGQPMPGGMNQFNMIGRNGMGTNMPNGGMSAQQNDQMRRAAMANQRPPNMQPGNRMNPAGAGPEAGSDGPRAASPMSGGDNAPSPKRQRLDNGPPGMNNPQMPRPGMPGQMQNGAMMGGGMKPGPGMPTSAPGPHGSPVLGPDNQMAMNNEMFQNTPGNQMQRGMNATNNNGQGGALADYQMQLMLLEQQNKKRLLMARQEQEIVNNSSGGQQGGAGNAQGMMGHPGFNGNPSSPMPGGSEIPNRNSPAPGFDMAAAQMNGGMFMGKMGEGGMNPGVMRPGGMPGGFQPSPQQMEMMRQNGRVPSGQWGPGGPMGPGQMGPGGPQPGPPGQGDNGQRGQMPPPSAPTANNQGRTQPSSPSQNQTAPPTPSQQNKANPKKGKAAKEDKKAPKKGPNATGAIFQSEDETKQPLAPSFPSLSSIPDSHKGPRGQTGQAQTPQNNQNTGGPPPPSTGGEGSQDNNAQAPFGNIDPSSNNEMEMFGFPNPEQPNNEVLDGFDFDAFLHMDNEIGQFDFDPTAFNMSNDSVEMSGQS